MAELPGERVLLRPLTAADVAAVAEIQAEPGVARWWGPPDKAELRRKAAGSDESTAFVIEQDGDLVGLIQYHEEDDPMYRHAGIDLFLSEEVHRQGLGTDAVRTLALHLVRDRGHHRLVSTPPPTMWRRSGPTRRRASGPWV
jgi:aminoglycoside 6'-N-acetyltransferase